MIETIPGVQTDDGTACSRPTRDRERAAPACPATQSRGPRTLLTIEQILAWAGAHKRPRRFWELDYSKAMIRQICQTVRIGDDFAPQELVP